VLAAVLTRFGGVDALEVREVAAPSPGPGEVVVDVAAAGVNNTDVWTRQGAYGRDEPAGWLGPVDFPRIQGADVCGYIAAIGEGVDAARLGRRVLVDPVLRYSDGPEALVAEVLGSEADGAYAEQVLVRADRVHDVADSALTDVELACLPISSGTAIGMLERAEVQAGHTVLVTGASGGVGLGLVSLAAGRGARVIALSSADKAAAVRAAGADAVLDRQAGDVGEQLYELVPAGVDAVADVVGGGFLTGLLPQVRAGGRWVVAGSLAGPVVELDLRTLYLRSIALLGSTMHTPGQFALLVEAARRGEVRPVVAATYPLTEIRAAHSQFERRVQIGKIALLPGL
jgi:NADPH:quinone reductase-like Zn-dependent oxidoreductase